MSTSINTILFDLDGTLLPMRQDEFVRVYFGELACKCAGYGYQPETLTNAIWAGTKAMVENEGNKTNEEIFWEVFAREVGPEILAYKPQFDLFYANEFNKAQAATRGNPYAIKVVRALNAKGYHVVLATNPLFPKVAVQSRLAWLGLHEQDFEHITSYEHCHYCKPNPAYYREILQDTGHSPQNCLMVGNDVEEDGCATTLGMDFYLITDDAINRQGINTTAIKQGIFKDFAAYAHALPALG